MMRWRNATQHFLATVQVKQVHPCLSLNVEMHISSFSDVINGWWAHTAHQSSLNMHEIHSEDIYHATKHLVRM